MSTVQDAPPIAVSIVTPTDDAPQPYEFTAQTFFRMLDAEVFTDEDRVELCDGRVVAKMAKKNAHSLSSAKVLFALMQRLPPAYFVSVENPLGIGLKQVPLPDIVVQRGVFDDYVDRRPTATDVTLVIELAESSLRYDTTDKLADYARAGVPCYWVVNLVTNVVLVFEQPNIEEGRYEVSLTFAIGQNVPFRLDGVLVAEIPAIDLLPVRSGPGGMP